MCHSRRQEGHVAAAALTVVHHAPERGALDISTGKRLLRRAKERNQKADSEKRFSCTTKRENHSGLSRT